MKATPNIHIPAIPNFPGILIDPDSGRKCALQQDIFKGLGLQGEQVRKTGARIYQGRYYDVEDVLEARSKIGTKRGPKPAGIILSELTATLATALAGVALSATLTSAISKGTAPISYEMVGARELQVRHIQRPAEILGAENLRIKALEKSTDHIVSRCRPLSRAWLIE